MITPPLFPWATLLTRIRTNVPFIATWTIPFSKSIDHQEICVGIATAANNGGSSVILIVYNSIQWLISSCLIWGSMGNIPKYNFEA